MRSALINAAEHSQIYTALTTTIDMEAPEKISRKMKDTKAFEADPKRYTSKKCPYDDPKAGAYDAHDLRLEVN